MAENVKPQEREEPFGMLITLKKRMSISERESTSQFLTMGSYDALEIHPISTWYDMRPQGVERVNAISSLDDIYMDKYTVKVVFPKGYKSAAPCHNFDLAREDWKKIGIYLNRTENKPEGIGRMLEENPFLSLGLINLSPEFTGQTRKLRDMQLYLEKCFCETAKDLSVNLDELHCAIFPCIGFSDFVVLFLSDKLRDVLCILDGIKNRRYREEPGHGKAREDEKAPQGCVIISNCYSITGIYHDGIGGLTPGNLEDIMASVRINLREGVSAELFRAKISSQQNGDYAYRIFGSADCLLIPTAPFVSFLPLYFDKKLLDPNSETFQAYIESTNTSLWVRNDGSVQGLEWGEENEEEESHRREKQKEKDDFIRSSRESYKEFIDTLKAFIREQNLPVRRANALQKVYKRYLNLIRYPHCFDIETIVSPVFEIFRENVLKSIDLCKDGRIAAEERLKCREDLMETVNIFRESIGDYLADLQRSDRNFVEGQFLSHPSIASATKLLFFYNQFINQFARRLVETEFEKNSREYQFIVISGGHDDTTSTDLFQYLDQSEKDLRSLILLTIPEMSLYDVQGTLFRLSHECFHFCGERFRRKRYEAFVKAISRYYGWQLALIEFGMNSSMVTLREDIKKFIADNVSGDKKRKEDEIDKLFREQREELKGRAAESLEEKLRELLRIEELDEGDLYEKVIEIQLKEALSQVFSEPLCRRETGAATEPGSDPDAGTGDRTLWREGFSGKFYEMTLHVRQEIIEKTIEILKRDGIRYSKFNLMKRDVSYYCEHYTKRTDGEYNEGQKEFIEYVFEQAVSPIRAESGGRRGFHIPPVSAMVDTLLYAAKEAYCDVLPVHFFNMRKEDFILAFIYEKWDLDEAFPDSPLNAIRMNLELSVCYGINRGLCGEHERQMGERMEQWKAQGFTYHGVSAKELIGKVDAVLTDNISEVTDYFLEPVRDYLKECLGVYDRTQLEKFGEERGLFTTASIENDLYEMLEYLISYWSGLSEKN